MKKIFPTLILLTIIITISCDSTNDNMVTSVPSLIKEGFIDNNHYEIVCRGFAKSGLQGIQKNASAKRAALLNAYYYTKNRFDDTIAPDRDGSIEKLEVKEDHVVIYYVIKKSNLKNRLKK